MHRNQLIKNLQVSGFSMIDKSPFLEATRQKALNYAIKKVKHSNKTSKSIGISDDELYLPEDCSYSSIRNLTRLYNQPLPQKTVIYRRHDSEERGLFLDIINPDIKIKELKEDLLNSSIFHSLEKTAGVSESDIEFHIYYTKDCLKPRSWHIDGPSLKIFTYLTDVSEKHGPYAYQLNSHRFYDKNYVLYNGSKLNLKSLKSEVTEKYYNSEDVISVMGKKGTSFISNQAGIHRGLDQKKYMERIVLVTQFL